MSTKDKEKLAAARKELKKFQRRKERKTANNSETNSLTTPNTETYGLLQELGGAPELTTPLATLSNNISLTTPTELSPTIPTSNGYVTSSSGWNLTTRPLTPDPPLLDRVHQKSLEETSYDGCGLEQDMQTQTIGILVSEKTSLQTENDGLRTDLRNKTREVEDLTGHLQSVRLQLEQNERLKLSLSEEKINMERKLRDEVSAREETEIALEKMRTEFEETRQENTELVSKVTSQAAELLSLRDLTSDLKSKLTMAELLTQQLSSSPTVEGGGGGGRGQVEELREEMERLERVVRSVSGERDQALSDLDALREAMIAQQQQSTERLSELHSRLSDSEAERLRTSEQLAEISNTQYELEKKTSSEQADLKHSTQVAMDTLEREKAELEAQLQSKVMECERLTESVSQLEEKMEEVEREGERLRETSIDSRSLMETISQDKEALSRTVTQNRQLKTQLEELQEGFVRLSQQNMDLATNLETEKYHVSKLHQQLQTEEQGGGEEGGEERKEEKEMEEMVEKLEMSTQTDPMEEEEEREVHTVQPTDEERETIHHLSHQLQEVEEERENFKHQLQEMERERNDLREELTQLSSQLSDNHSTNERSSSRDDDETANQTMDILSSLQTNFNALQERYVRVMKEKAELQEVVEERELTIGQLSGETETIGEYIMLYQSQREALRLKFKEKDNFIQRLISEKEVIQTQLAEVQRLMKQVMRERTNYQHHPQPSPPPPPSPPSSPPTPSSPSSLPVHLQQKTAIHHHHNNKTPSPPPPPPPPLDSAPVDTVEQIYQLLSEIGGDGDTMSTGTTIGPCPCCTGDIIAV